jgi:hypothetical protein
MTNDWESVRRWRLYNEITKLRNKISVLIPDLKVMKVNGGLWSWQFCNWSLSWLVLKVNRKPWSSQFCIDMNKADFSLKPKMNSSINLNWLLLNSTGQMGWKQMKSETKETGDM